MHGYLCGRSKPPADDKLLLMAQGLGLEGDDLTNFIWLAQQPYTPTMVWTKIQQQQHDLKAMRQELVGEQMKFRNLAANLTAAEEKATATEAELARLNEKLSQVLAQQAALMRKKIE